MGILKGALGVRRYRIEGEVLAGDRDRMIAALNGHAFREPLSPVHKEEIMGWTQIHNLLDTDFSDINQWYYNQYIVFAMRIDKKTLPARLFKAHLEKKMAAWCKETGRERVPAKVKEELKSLLEVDMLRQTLPKVSMQEVTWNTKENWVIIHNQSDGINDKFRKLFHQTFGVALMPFTPLDFIGDRPEQVDQLLSAGTSTVGEGT